MIGAKLAPYEIAANVGMGDAPKSVFCFRSGSAQRAYELEYASLARPADSTQLDSQEMVVVNPPQFRIHKLYQRPPRIRTTVLKSPRAFR